MYALNNIKQQMSIDNYLNPVGPRSPVSAIMDGKKAEEPEEHEEGAEQIPLPSKGVFYMPPNFLKEEIWVRPMDFRDENILTTEKYITEGTVFDKIVTAIIQEKNITAGKLVPIDRDTILLWLRANALGKIMSVDYKCVNPKCNKPENVATWDLSEIKIPEYDPEVLKELQDKGELRVVTPLKSVVVYVKVPLIEDSNDTQKKYLKRKEMNEEDVDTLATTALSLIVSGVEIDGKIVRKKDAIMNYFTKMKLPISDSRWIRREAKKVSLKYDTAKDLVCKNCGHVQENVEMPIVHQNFLWLDGEAPLGAS